MLHGWICGTIEWEMNEKLDNTSEFVTLLKMWGCWMRYEREIDNKTEFVILLNKWDCWKRWECKTR